MNARNDVDLDFRNYTENRDTDVRINIQVENVDDTKLCQILNTWLGAIGSNIMCSLR